MAALRVYDWVSSWMEMAKVVELDFPVVVESEPVVVGLERVMVELELLEVVEWVEAGPGLVGVYVLGPG